MIKITRQQAIKYSIVKWERAYETGCTNYDLDIWLTENHYEISLLQDGCGLCQYYTVQKEDCSAWCSDEKNNKSKCPLAQCGENCRLQDSYYRKWQYAPTVQARKNYAMLILALIRN